MIAMLSQPQPVTEFVASHPGAVWAVGPFFAAVTGVAFKEGVCYGKPECAVLFFLTPALLLGKLLLCSKVTLSSQIVRELKSISALRFSRRLNCFFFPQGTSVA